MTKVNNLVVADCDEVICNISPKWFQRIMADFEPFQNYFVNMGQMSDKAVLLRKEYYLNRWLALDGKKVPMEVFQRFYDLYADDTFYDDLQVTPIGKGLRAMLKTPMIGKLVVLTHTEERNLKSKERFLVRNFPSRNVEIVFLPHDIGKADFLKSEKVPYDLIIEDRWDFVQDIIQKTDSRGKSFLLPDLGYNRFSVEEALLYNANYGAIVSRYKAIGF